jgi:uncharacterized Tic20 family protein
MTDDRTPASAPAEPLGPTDERMWSTLIHVGGIVLGFLAPLLGYLLLKDRSAFVGENARNALNFQLTVLIGYAASVVLMLVLIGFLTYPLVWVLSIVLSILAAVAANRGEVYRYPLAIAFIK